MTSSVPLQTSSDTQQKPAVHTLRVVLTGFMGAGKSTVGRLLAKELGWQFCDTDVRVETEHGCSIAEIFQVEGEAMFRRRESLAIARALGQQQVVVALGGGASEVLTNRLLLEQTDGTTVIFLDAPFSVLFDRCVLQEGAALRPVLMDPGAAEVRFQTRAPHYVRSAHHRIDTTSLTPFEIVGRILKLLAADAK